VSGTKPSEIQEVAPDHPHVIRLLKLYFAELRTRLPPYEPPSVDDLRADGERGVTLVLFEDCLPAGCGSLRLLDPRTAEVKRARRRLLTSVASSPIT
jgi:hypothetical protein